MDFVNEFKEAKEGRGQIGNQGSLYEEEKRREMKKNSTLRGLEYSKPRLTWKYLDRR